MNSFSTNRNILVIGNIFDLYPKLPTKYINFLEFTKYWNEFYKNYNDLLKNDSIKTSTNKISNNTLVNNNSWLNYFYNLKYEEKGWVDFENEI